MKCYMVAYVTSLFYRGSYAYLDLYTEVDKSFPKWIAFLSWKEEQEKLTCTCFVKPNGKVICDKVQKED